MGSSGESGKRKVVYCHSQAEAVYALHQAQHARLFGTLTSTRNETVEAFLLKWLQYEVQPRVRERTYQTYQQVVTCDLLPTLGHINCISRNVVNRHLPLPS